MLLLERTKLVVEGAGAVGVAALLAGKIAGRRAGGRRSLRRQHRRQHADRGRCGTGSPPPAGTSSCARRCPTGPASCCKLLQLVAEERVNVLSVEHRREGVDIPVGATGHRPDPAHARRGALRGAPRPDARMGLRGRAAAVALAARCSPPRRPAAAGATDESQTTRPAASTLSSPFAYDASRPLAYRDEGRVNSPYPIAVDDVSYAAPGGRVPAYLALPNKGTKLPAVIYLHGSGEGRERFLLPAVWAAGEARGRHDPDSAVQQRRRPAGGLSPCAALARDRRIFAARRDRRAPRGRPAAAACRRSTRSASGSSAGASAPASRAVTAGVEPRLRAVVLMSGGSLPVSAYVAQAPAALRPQVRQSLTQIDPLRWMARAHPGLGAAPGRPQGPDRPAGGAGRARRRRRRPGSVVRWYPAGHELNAQVYRDQLAFLAKKLPIDGPPVPGAQNRPVIDSPRGSGPPGAKGRHGPLRRPRRLHLARRAARPRGRRRRARPLPRRTSAPSSSATAAPSRSSSATRSMALFGAPTTHEDDPERAVRAALAIREWARRGGRRGADRRQHRRGARARRRASGGRARRWRPATWSTRARGSRRPRAVNGIVVGEQTFRATEQTIDYRELEPVEAKGKSRPVAGVGGARRPARGSPSSASTARRWSAGGARSPCSRTRSPVCSRSGRHSSSRSSASRASARAGSCWSSTRRSSACRS